MTLCTVLNKTDSASLWKHMITLVVGSLVEYFLCFSRHLKGKKIYKFSKSRAKLFKACMITLTHD